MNVTELARRLNITTNQLFDEIEKLGFDIGRKAIKVDEKVAQKILKELRGKVKRRTKVEEEELEEVKSAKGGEKKIRPEDVIELPFQIVVKDFAEKLNVPITDVLAELLKNGIMSSMNERIDYETAAILAEDLGFKTVFKSEDKEVEEKITQEATILKKLLEEDKKSQLKRKPPVVVVMGHVDHGKTALLDAIRQSKVAESEAGRITQHIGAYQVKEKDRLITFIDTPGHEAFTAMRSRGARVADIAILVIAADDGVQPQTIESLNTIQAASLPFIVAINKIDKEGADIDKVKKELSELNLIPEDWGGKVIWAPVSAKEKKGIKELLDIVILVADLEKEKIKANPQRKAVGTIIESHVDKGEGPVATILIRTGSLKKGDIIQTGQIGGKIKMMKDFQGNLVEKAPPSMPVKILGLKDIPEVGDVVQVVDTLKSLKKTIKQVRAVKPEEVSPQDSRVSKEKLPKSKILNLVIKADTLGSLEAIEEALNNLKHPEVGVEIISTGLGNINETDIMRAEAGKAIILGFQIVPLPAASQLAQEKEIKIQTFEVIYDLIKEVKSNLEKLLTPEIIQINIGKIKILAIFRQETKSMIVGGKVIEGRVENKAQVRIIRDDSKIAEGQIVQLQQEKKNVKEVSLGSECGLKIVGEPLIQVGDVLEVFQEESQVRKIE